MYALACVVFELYVPATWTHRPIKNERRNDIKKDFHELHISVMHDGGISGWVIGMLSPLNLLQVKNVSDIKK